MLAVAVAMAAVARPTHHLGRANLCQTRTAQPWDGTAHRVCPLVSCTRILNRCNTQYRDSCQSFESLECRQDMLAMLAVAVAMAAEARPTHHLGRANLCQTRTAQPWDGTAHRVCPLVSCT